MLAQSLRLVILLHIALHLTRTSFQATHLSASQAGPLLSLPEGDAHAWQPRCLKSPSWRRNGGECTLDASFLQLTSLAQILSFPLLPRWITCLALGVCRSRLRRAGLTLCALI